MSSAPYAVSGKVRSGNKMGDMSMIDTMVNDGLTDAFNHYHMGITAENIADQYSISREEQDEFAARSQTRAVDAINSGKFEQEIVPIEVRQRKATVSFDTDEYPRAGTTAETLAKLRPAFKKDGSVTAGNASGLNDGAVALVVVSETALKAHNLTPLVEVVATGQGGVDPSVMGLGPIPAIGKALAKTDLKLSDMDCIELNEAFAAQAIGVMKGLSEQHDVDFDWFANRTNLNGGAIALGHPIGVSGARIVTTLIYEMQRSNAEHGLASLCIGGGMGTAVILKRV
jgi:acetyl-CoA C-acetyltransferase